MIVVLMPMIGCAFLVTVVVCMCILLYMLCCVTMIMLMSLMIMPLMIMPLVIMCLMIMVLMPMTRCALFMTVVVRMRIFLCSGNRLNF
jgi:hypothetical protein